MNNIHYRQIYLYEITCDKAGLDEYKQNGKYDLIYLKKRADVASLYFELLDPHLVALFQHSLDASSDGLYSEATSAYEKLLMELRRFGYQNRLKKAKAIYTATKKKSALKQNTASTIKHCP